MNLKSTKSVLLSLLLALLSISSNLFAITISGNVIGNGTLEFYKLSPDALNGTTSPIVNTQSAMVPLNSNSVLNSGDLVTIYANPSKLSKLRSFSVDGVNYISSPVTITVGASNINVSGAFSNGNILFQESYGQYMGSTQYDKITLPSALSSGAITLDNPTTFASYSFAIGTNVKFLNQSNTTDPNATCFFTYERNNAITTTFATPLTGSNLQLKLKLNPNIPTSTATAWILGLDSALRIRVNDIWQYRCLNKALITTFRKSLSSPLQSSYAYETPYITIPLSVNSINKIEIRSELVAAANQHGQFYFDDIVIVSDSMPKIGNTIAISSITNSSALSGGNIISDGGTPITARGICWSRLPNPTIDNGFKTIEDGNTGSFSSSLINLLGETKYYVRSYATNEVGTVYGNEISLTTSAGGTCTTYDQFIMYGQSLSVGAHSYPALSVENVSGNFQIGDQVWYNYGNIKSNSLNPLTSNIAALYATQSSIMNGDAVTPAECPLTGAVNHVKQKNGGNPIIASSCGTAGMSIEQLSKESQTKTFYNIHFLPAVRSAVQITQFLNSKVICPAIFWMQGESNYMGVGEGLTPGSLPTADKISYKDLLVKLKNNMQTDIQNVNGQTEKPLFISYQVGGTSQRGRDLAIGMAQLEMSNEISDFICAGPIYPVTNRGLHLDPNGYRWFGEMLAKAYYKTKILNEPFKPLQPKKISRTSNPNELKIEFHVPNLPLVIDEKLVAKVDDSGFEIYLDNVKQTINSVNIVGDAVMLTCAVPLNGSIEVVYAGTTFKGKGNLRDSDPYQSYYQYIDLDKTNPDGTFVYPRDAGITTLRPAYEPKGADGNPIYNQNYPLFNFSLSFYFKLNVDQNVLNILNTELTTVKKKLESDNDIQAYQYGNSLIVKTNNIVNKVVTVSIFKTSGELLKKINFSQSQVNIALKSMNKGIYIVCIEHESKLITVKLVIS